jgi:hypothetical protein
MPSGCKWTHVLVPGTPRSTLSSPRRFEAAAKKSAMPITGPARWRRIPLGEDEPHGIAGVIYGVRGSTLLCSFRQLTGAFRIIACHCLRSAIRRLPRKSGDLFTRHPQQPCPRVQSSERRAIRRSIPINALGFRVLWETSQIGARIFVWASA